MYSMKQNKSFIFNLTKNSAKSKLIIMIII